ncbi:MAG: wax ester/triacylglycerol synthase family O-acyltransferase [Spirochaetaceae bacterium]|nr:wax ester/triacylglycerol synthase family O-acyltransferase [Spirochaetaceae bacterium]
MANRNASSEGRRPAAAAKNAARPLQLCDEDGVFLSIETAAAPSCIAGLTIVDAAAAPGFGLERYLEILGERTRMVERFRWRLMPTPLGVDNAYWVEAEDFEVADHVKAIALPAPGDRQTLARIVGLLHGLPLDPNRPLWECWWIEGLEGGRVATLLKFHHCLMDGESGMGLAQILLDLTSEPARFDLRPNETEERPPRAPTPAEMLRSAVRNAARRPARIALHARRALRDGFTRLAAARGDRPEGAPSVPTTPFNARLSGTRAFAYATLPLGPIRDAAKHFDVKVNDVLLELLASTLRRVLARESRLPSRSIVALCPVSLRRDGDRSAGNRLSSMPVSLATDLADPVARLLAIHRSSKLAKARLEEGAFEVMTALTECFLPGALRLATRAAHAVPSLLPLPGNLVFSNVRGLGVPLYLAGARVEVIHPMSMLQVGNGMNVTAVSHDDQVDFGFLVDAQLVPDPWGYADALERALEELTTAVEGRLAAEGRPVRSRSTGSGVAMDAASSSDSSSDSSFEGETETSEPIDLMLIMSGLAHIRAPSRRRRS